MGVSKIGVKEQIWPSRSVKIIGIVLYRMLGFCFIEEEGPAMKRHLKVAGMQSVCISQWPINSVEVSKKLTAWLSSHNSFLLQFQHLLQTVVVAAVQQWRLLTTWTNSVYYVYNAYTNHIITLSQMRLLLLNFTASLCHASLLQGLQFHMSLFQQDYYWPA